MPVNESLEHVLDKEWEKKSLKEIVSASPSVLEGISDTKAEALKAALGVKTIEQLATNKYVLWAQALTTLAKAEK
jgi:hypothetical protein